MPSSSTAASGQVMGASVYNYDESGNRTARRFSDDSVETYAYDAMLRLVQAKHPCDSVSQWWRR